MTLLRSSEISDSSFEIQSARNCWDNMVYPWFRYILGIIEHPIDEILLTAYGEEGGGIGR